jgi:hypothetical protein
MRYGVVKMVVRAVGLVKNFKPTVWEGDQFAGRIPLGKRLYREMH